MYGNTTISTQEYVIQHKKTKEYATGGQIPDYTLSTKDELVMVVCTDGRLDESKKYTAKGIKLLIGKGLVNFEIHEVWKVETVLKGKCKKGDFK